MKNRLFVSAALIFLAGAVPALAGSKEASAQAAPAVSAEDARTREFKDILFKLVRQDEYLDEAVEMLDTSTGRTGAQDLAALGVSLRTISNNLKHVAALNKAEFASVQPGSQYARYTNAILSYSRKVDRKAVQVSGLISKLAAGSKKAVMRDAVSSKKGGRKARGRSLDQILAEQKAMQKLASDARGLRVASRNLSATSKWLYIASK